MPNVTVSAQIPIELWEATNEIVKNGKYKTMSELIRKAMELILEEET